MRIGFFSDVHLWNHTRFGGVRGNGLNERGRLCIRVFKQALVKLQSMGADSVYILGDLFEGCRPESGLIAAAQEVMRSVAFPYGYNLMAGNHDQQSTEIGDSALAPLSPCGVVHEQFAAQLRQIVLMPYTPEEPLKKLHALLGVTRSNPMHRGPGFLGLHLGIKDDHTPVELARSPQSAAVGALADLAREYGIDAVAAGHWHSPRIWNTGGVRVVQCGTLCPTGFRDTGSNYGRVYTLDLVTREIDLASIPGPRFFVVRTEGELVDLQAKGNEEWQEHDLYVRWICRQKDIAMAQESIAGLLKRGNIHGGEVVPEAAAYDAQVRDAAERASRAGTTHSAIREYVMAMPLGYGVSREAVLDEVLSHLVERAD